MINPTQTPGTRATDVLDEPMAKLYARDPSLWQILQTMWNSVRSCTTEQRWYAAILTGLTGSQNDFVKGAITHIVGFVAHAGVAIASVFR